ncbi:hypothetical protein [Streptomyces sp. NPDC093225]|uniref:hypothetical protein n=1 Tax=Streptomyces sp. NPDC093225 TaxID=3366034 RepID=UPI0037FEE916
MKKILGFLGFVLVAGGISGLVHEWFDGFRLFGFLRHLAPDGYELYANIVYVVVGVALSLYADSLKESPAE